MTDLGLLGPIIAAKRTELGERLGDMPIEKLRANATPTTRSLKAALDRPGGRFIFEYKRASPSEGPLNAGADPDADGFGNLQEHVAGTVPVDPHSRPAGTAVRLVPVDDGDPATSEFGYAGDSAIK